VRHARKNPMLAIIGNPPPRRNPLMAIVGNPPRGDKRLRELGRLAETDSTPEAWDHFYKELIRYGKLDELLDYGGRDPEAKRLYYQTMVADPEGDYAEPYAVAWSLEEGEKVEISFGHSAELNIYTTSGKSAFGVSGGHIRVLPLSTLNTRGNFVLFSPTMAQQEGDVLAIKRVGKDYKKPRAKSSSPRAIKLGTKRTRAIFEGITEATSHSLDDNFTGTAVPLDYARSADGLEANAIDLRASLTPDASKGPNTYRLHYHSNHWVRFVSPPQGKKPKEKRKADPAKATVLPPAYVGPNEIADLYREAVSSGSDRSPFAILWTLTKGDRVRVRYGNGEQATVTVGSIVAKNSSGHGSETGGLDVDVSHPTVADGGMLRGFGLGWPIPSQELSVAFMPVLGTSTPMPVSSIEVLGEAPAPKKKKKAKKKAVTAPPARIVPVRAQVGPEEFYAVVSDPSAVEFDDVYEILEEASRRDLQLQTFADWLAPYLGPDEEAELYSQLDEYLRAPAPLPPPSAPTPPADAWGGGGEQTSLWNPPGGVVSVMNADTGEVRGYAGSPIQAAEQAFLQDYPNEFGVPVVVCCGHVRVGPWASKAFEVNAGGSRAGTRSQFWPLLLDTVWYSATTLYEQQGGRGVASITKAQWVQRFQRGKKPKTADVAWERFKRRIEEEDRNTGAAIVATTEPGWLHLSVNNAYDAAWRALPGTVHQLGEWREREILEHDASQARQLPHGHQRTEAIRAARSGLRGSADKWAGLDRESLFAPEEWEIPGGSSEAYEALVARERGGGVVAPVQERGSVGSRTNPQEDTGPVPSEYEHDLSEFEDHPGYREAWDDVSEFHSADPVRIVVYEINDGSSEDTWEPVHAALHETIETNYQVPWENSNKHQGANPDLYPGTKENDPGLWTHKHPKRKGVKPPLEVKHPFTQTTRKILRGSKVGDWWHS